MPYGHTAGAVEARPAAYQDGPLRSTSRTHRMATCESAASYLSRRSRLRRFMTMQNAKAMCDPRGGGLPHHHRIPRLVPGVSGVFSTVSGSLSRLPAYTV